MEYTKKEAIDAFKAMIAESIKFVLAYFEVIKDRGMHHEGSEKILRQMANHLMVLHHALPIVRRLFSKQELELLASECLIDNIEEVYIAGLKDGTFPRCFCNYCKEQYGK